MPIKWTVALAMLFLFLTIISGVMEMVYITSSDTGIFHDLTHPEMGKGAGSNLPGIVGDIVGGVTGFFTAAWDFLLALLKLVTFDYAMFQGAWLVVRFFFLCIAIGWIVSLVLAFRGTASA